MQLCKITSIHLSISLDAGVDETLSLVYTTQFEFV